MSTVLFAWPFTFSSQLTAPPNSGQVRANAAEPYAGVSALYLSNTNGAGEDIWIGLRTIPIGATIYVQDKNDHNYAASFTTTAAPIDRDGYFELPVAFGAVVGPALFNNQPVGLVVLTEPPEPLVPTEPVRLVTLAVAKQHLHVTDPARDAEVLSKIEQASDAIKKYIDTQYDDTWTETTAPPVVQASVLELVALFWRDRGDDDDVSADRTWRHIEILLKQTRDPVIA